MPIREALVKGAINPNISHSLMYAEFDACVSCGLDLWKWWNNEYPPDFKARVIAFNNLRGLVRLNTEDAVARASSRRSKG